MVTEKQKREFGLHKAHGIEPKKEKPTHGDLVEILYKSVVINGSSVLQPRAVNILEENKPFALLQVMKKNYINKGYSPKSLKITYKK